jgi:hypothetical protein
MFNGYWVILKVLVNTGLLRLSYIYIMRVVTEIAHPELKITIFHWNNRYLIKLEAGLFEQTYKVHEHDVDSEETITKLVNEEFIKGAIDRFNQMAKSLQTALEAN